MIVLTAQIHENHKVTNLGCKMAYFISYAQADLELYEPHWVGHYYAEE